MRDWVQPGACRVKTIYDWVAVAVFAGLIVLFMQRSTQEVPRDSLWQYLVAAIGCAVTNYFGNTAVEGGGVVYHLLGIATLVATIAFIFVVLKPLQRG
jgi:hypothetical protein